MTVAELMRALQEYHPDQYVQVTLHSDAFPDGANIIIQGVKAQAPSKPRPGLPDIVAIVAHDRNKELPR